MRAPLGLSLALLACSGASGCMTAAVAGAAGVGLFAVQDRTIGEGIDDAAASAELKARLLRAENNAFARVDVEVAQGRALLSGAVPTMEHRLEAERLAWTVRQIAAVSNEITVGPRTGFFRSAYDEAITAQVRARLLADQSVRAININIETYDGVVYLMGLTRSQEELARAAEKAAYVRGVRKVVSYMEVRDRPADASFGRQTQAAIRPDYPPAASSPVTGEPADIR